MDAIFQYARDILECFTISAISDSKNLDNLKNQFEKHKQFKIDRIRKLGWDIDEKSTSNLDDSDELNDIDKLNELIDTSSKLLSKCEEILHNDESKACIQVLCRFRTFSHDIPRLMTSASKRRQHEEAARLKDLGEQVKSIYEEIKSSHFDGFYPCNLENLHASLVEAMSTSIKKLIAAEQIAAEKAV